jgi:hypothetical protein
MPQIAQGRVADRRGAPIAKLQQMCVPWAGLPNDAPREKPPSPVPTVTVVVVNTPNRYIPSMARQARFSEQLRRLYLKSGVSHYRVAKDTGLDKAAVSRFARGQAFLSQEGLDALAEYFSWDVVASPRKGK